MNMKPPERKPPSLLHKETSTPRSKSSSRSLQSPQIIRHPGHRSQASRRTTASFARRADAKARCAAAASFLARRSRFRSSVDGACFRSLLWSKQCLESPGSLHVFTKYGHMVPTGCAFFWNTKLSGDAQRLFHLHTVDDSPDDSLHEVLNPPIRPHPED